MNNGDYFMKIFCENRLCIYYENGVCSLDCVSLDAVGVCTDGIHIDIEEEFLAERRKNLMEKLERSNKNER